MLMTVEKPKNKVQEYAAKVGIRKQVELRRALAEYGIAEATAQALWNYGAVDLKSYRTIMALAEVLGVPPDKFLE